MTGQDAFASYEDINVAFAIDLVNELAIDHAFGRLVAPRDGFATLQRVLAFDPPSAGQLRDEDVPAFLALAQRLHRVFQDLHHGDVDAAATRLNALLAAHPAHPHLAKDAGRWRLHHHPVDAPLVPMATAVCADGLARLVGADQAARLGTCDSDECDRVFLDESKNASRRFCSTTCQNRVKAAAFRRRRTTARTGRLER